MSHKTIILIIIFPKKIIQKFMVKKLTKNYNISQKNQK